jgi:hypothetical protein
LGSGHQHRVAIEPDAPQWAALFVPGIDGSLQQDGSDKADGLAVRAQRLLSEEVGVGGFFADGCLKSALLTQRHRQSLDGLPLHELRRAIRQAHVALEAADHVQAIVCSNFRSRPGITREGSRSESREAKF